MKFAALPGRIACILLLIISLIPYCRKKDQMPSPPVTPGGSNQIDTISNHFRFVKYQKMQGNIPRGPANPSLKISFKDTLRLVDEIPRPIKFLHEASANVAGVFIQAVSIGGSATSTHYYDVPESENSADSDTVSIIMIGIDPEGLDVPLEFEVTITPYDKTKKPLGEATRPVKIDEPKNTPTGNGTECGLVLPSGDRWEWELSFISDNNSDGVFDFESFPGKVFGAGGQDIEGSCCNGHSKWPLFCVGEKTHNKTLHFGTYYKIDFETIRFFSNGTFFRQTMEDSPVPLPDESDFCAGGSGKVRESLKHSTYEGDWTLSPAVLPADLKGYKDDTLDLSMRGTGGTGYGYGNPGGVIHQLDCEFLTLIQVAREGRGHLFKMYKRRSLGDPLWYPFE